MTDRLTYTVPEVAEMLGISRSTAYVCVRRGEIPALKLAGRVVISRVAFDALLAAGASVSTERAPASASCVAHLTPRSRRN